MVAYNVQSAVDITNHLIVAHEVTNIGTDRSQLATMAQAAKEPLGDTPMAEYAANRSSRRPTHPGAATGIAPVERYSFEIP